MKLRIVSVVGLKQIVDEGLQLRPKGRWYEKHTHIYVCRIIAEAIITVLATLSGRNRRRQVHYRLYSQLAFCDRNDEFVAPCWNTGRENLTGKTTIVLCNVLFFVVL